MVFLHFPSNYTDEELMLQAKYNKLRKKKKALEQMKDPKIEVEKVNPLKRPLDPKDAKEFAKKLIMSGKVALPQKQGDEKKTVFKRPRTLERKILATGRTEGHGGLTPGYNANYLNDFQFEPFTPAPEMSSSSPTSTSTSSSMAPPPVGPLDKSSHPQSPSALSPSNHSLGSSSSIVSSHQKRHKMTNNMKEKSESYGERTTPQIKGVNKTPKRGPTVYIQAHNITDEILRHEFGKFGKILNVKLHNPTVGFVTFDKVESAELAVQEMNGGSVDGVSYDVQFARRQPSIGHLMNDASASAQWTACATNNSQRSNHKDRRQQVVYDEFMEGLEG